MTDPVRPLVLVAAVEAVAAILLLVGVVAAVARGAAEGLTGAGPGLAVAEVVIWALVAAALGAIWWGLFRRRRVARTPFLMAQAFALVVVPSFVGSDVAAWRAAGWLLGALALAGLVLGLRPSVRSGLH